jgi:hypothetical protein
LAAAQNASFPTTVMLSEQHHNDSIRKLHRSTKPQSRHFNIAQLFFTVAYFTVLSLIYSCGVIETLKPHSESPNRLPDIETRAYKNRRAFPKPVALPGQHIFGGGCPRSLFRTINVR